MPWANYYSAIIDVSWTDGFTSDFDFLNVDRHEWKKQAHSITFEQAWLHIPQNSLGFEYSLIVISLESIDIQL